MEVSAVIGITILLILGPVLVKFADRSYKASKKSEIYKDLFDEDKD